jgi:hypothetical protein
MSEENKLGQIQAARLGEVAPDVDAFYEAFIRNGYILAERSCPLITRDYLNKVSAGAADVNVQVRLGLVWTPRDRDCLDEKKGKKVVYRNCAAKPDKKTLWDILSGLLKARKLDMGIDSVSKQPKRSYLILCISTLDPDNSIFRKDYVPEPKQTAAKFEPVIDNTDQFFSDLPMKKVKGKNGKYYTPRMTLFTPQQRLEFAIQREEFNIKKRQAKM